jgi:hypothetical protein
MGCGCEDTSSYIPMVEERPILPVIGRFLIQLCVTLEDVRKLVDALYYARGLSSPCDCWEDTSALDILLRGLNDFGIDISGDCNMALCDDLTACLTPFFDALTNKLDDVALLTSNAASAANGSAAKPPSAIQLDYDCEYWYSGAMAVVQFMHKQNMQYYAEAEVSLPDNLNEAAATLIQAFPILGELPFDELYNLVDAKFQNQALDYEADYASFEEPAALALMRRIEAANGTFTYDIWGAWLENLIADGVPFPNKATDVFGRYSPLKQTFLNQIAALLNSEKSLQSYFQDIYREYYIAAQSGLSLPAGEICGSLDSGTYDTESAEAQLNSGEWVEDLPNMRLARANDETGVAEFEIDFGTPVTLVKFSFHTRTLTSGGGTSNPNTGSAKIYNGETLIATLFSFSRPNDWGYNWTPEDPRGANGDRGVTDSTVGAGTEFTRIVFTHTHTPFSRNPADVRGSVTIATEPV